MKNIRIKTLVFITMIGDVIIYYASFFISSMFVNYMGIPYYFKKESYLIILVSSLSIYILMRTFEMYKNIFYRGKADIVITISLVIIINTIALVIIAYFFDYHFSDHRRTNMIILVITQVALLSLWRSFIWMIRKNNCVKQNILIYGDLNNAKEVTQKIINKQGHLFNVKYIYDVKEDVSGLYSLLKKVDHIVIGNDVPNENVKDIFIYCMKNNKNVFFIPDIHTIFLRNAQFIQLDDVPVFNSTRFGLSFEQKLIKRTIDVVISLIGIIVTLPIMLVVAILVKSTSPGPIFFKQLRATIDNKEFHVYKFRTMVNNAESQTGPVLAASNDSRITSLGKFLRTSRLDEIPQLFNVLGGSMSLIGPRPERPHFISQFIEETPEYMFRMQVKAGITGLAQVLGKYTTNFTDKLKYDLLYIRNYSLALDINILIKTVKVVLNQESSAGLAQDANEIGFFINGRYLIKRTEYGYEISNTKEDL